MDPVDVICWWFLGVCVVWFIILNWIIRYDKPIVRNTEESLVDYPYCSTRGDAMVAEGGRSETAGKGEVGRIDD